MIGKHTRSTVRLRAQAHSGTVVLRRLSAPLILCDLHDISEMGCRCVARVRVSDWTDTEKWRAFLRSGELYEAEITFDPYIPYIRLPVEIRSSIALPGDGYELGLAFFELEPDHREMLNSAMISIATEKIKQSRGVLKRDASLEMPPEQAEPARSNASLYAAQPQAPAAASQILKTSSGLWTGIQSDSPPPAQTAATVARLESELENHAGVDWISAPHADELAPPEPHPEHTADESQFAVSARVEAFAREHRTPMNTPAFFSDDYEPVSHEEHEAHVPAAAASEIIPAPSESGRNSAVSEDAPLNSATSFSAPAPAPSTRPRLSAFVRPHYEAVSPPAAQRVRRPAPPPVLADEMIQVPVHDPEMPKIKFGEVLAQSGRLTRPEVHEAISSARHTGERLGEYLVRHGKLTPIEILQARSAQTGIPFVDLDSSHIKSDLLELFPFSRMKRDEFVPFEGETNIVRIGVARPLSQAGLAELSRISGRRIEQFLCREDLPREFLESVARRFERHRRAHPRFKISLPMSFQCCPPDGPPLSTATFRGRTVDISEEGLQVTGPVILGLDSEKLSPGQLRMMVTIGAVPQDIVGLCETRHMRVMRGSGGGTSCVYGLKLDQMSQPHREVLQGMLARVTRAQPGFYTDEPPLPHSTRAD